MSKESARGPSEASVVEQIRNWQWRRQAPLRMAAPDLSIQLGKAAERFLGDLIIEDDTRFFLLEVKASSAEIDEEWMNAITKKRKPEPKKAISTLRAELARLNATTHDNSFGAEEFRIWQSLRCHHFAYWQKEDSAYPSLSESVCISPYLWTVCQKGGILPSEDIANGLRLLAHYDFAFDAAAPDESARGEVWAALIDSATLDMMQLKKTHIICKPGSKDSSGLTRMDLGLPINEFQSYVNFMCRNRNLETRSLVMANGACSQVLGNTKDIEAFVSEIAAAMDTPAAKAGTNSAKSLRANAFLATAAMSHPPLSSTFQRKPSRP